MTQPRRSGPILRGLVAGALGGLVAALADYAGSRGEAMRFLPGGAGRLAAFLVALYAATGAMAGVAVGAACAVLARSTDLGPLARRMLGSSDRPRGRWLAYLIAIPVAALAHGAALYAITLTALYRFHAHLPIAALVGAAAAG